MNFYEQIEYNWFTGYIPMEHYRYVFQEHRVRNLEYLSNHSE
jgi:beta-lactamase class D